ncbi:MAG: methyltransferase domain-containing protein [Nitrospirae bacterium]|nr:MAG: methyltransferase domain-containing protein [Nitrospirota bacterium]
MSLPSDGPSPALFFQTINAYQRTEALKTAIELDLFTTVAQGNRTAREIAQCCGASERGIRMLANSLAAIGFLKKDGQTYALTPDSAMFLDARSPAYLGGTLAFLLSPPLVEGFRRLSEAVRKGGTAISPQGTLEPEHPEWVTFARSMAPLMKGPAIWIAEWVKRHAPHVKQVLDVAAGHGVFGVEIAKVLPQTKIMALDWPSVLMVAQEQAKVAGVHARFHLLPGSAFDVELPQNVDLVLLTNFLHHFDEATCVSLLKRLYACLTEAGIVVTLEFMPNEDRVSPPAVAEFALIMLATTPAGDAYTFREYERMFRRAGFGASEWYDVPASNQRAIVTRK